MKYLIVFILLFSCKNLENDTKALSFNNQIKGNFYEIIFNELDEIDTKAYYITYDVIDDFRIDEKTKSILLENNIITLSEKNKLSQKFILDNYNLNLSPVKQALINHSAVEKGKKTELNYTFSKPYQIGKDKVVIINLITYKSKLSKGVKGGSKRVIIFEIENEVWKITQLKNFIDY
ncbi:MAG: hypothetical protein WA775_14535 [Psychroserpens sp.]|uniref:hypothetical protein n=1 Tax=Psychroserpens sp. TaxID=2020870 RepID=UPI003C9AF088